MFVKCASYGDYLLNFCLGWLKNLVLKAGYMTHIKYCARMYHLCHRRHGLVLFDSRVMLQAPSTAKVTVLTEAS